MQYTITYNGENGKHQILLDPNSTKKPKLKNELYGKIYVTENEGVAEYKIVSFIPKEIDMSNSSIINDDFSDFINLVYPKQIDDFDIIYDVLFKVLDREIIKENVLILFG